MTDTTSKTGTGAKPAAPEAEARNTARTAQESAQSAADHVSRRAEGLRDEAAGLMRDGLQAGRSAIDARASEVAGAAADDTEALAAGLRDSANDMTDGSPQARIVGTMASTLDDAARGLRDTDLSTVVHELSDFARRNPVAFLGGAALVGFAASRFTKASSRDHQSQQRHSSGYGRSASAEPPRGPVPAHPAAPAPAGAPSQAGQSPKVTP